MKRVMIVIIVMVMLIGISEKAQAGPWTRSAFSLGSRHRSTLRVGLSHRFVSRPILGRSSWTGSAFGLGGRGRFLRTNSTFGKIMVGGQTLNRILTNNKLVDHKISVDNRVVSMHEREQAFRHGQHRIIGARRGTVLRTTVPVRRIIKAKPEKAQKNQKLQQEIEALKIQLEKLQQELQAKK